MEFETLRTGLSDEGCGCPEEELIIDGVNTIIHLEPDGSGHAFFDTGDWDAEELFDVTTMDSLRKKAYEWVAALPPNND